ncbi:MAG TPA: C4-type zinc ribbon domain-containing protein [Candidatus Dormibacteraeota bacterium]|nr:C4-type zinc ribbon domain-containing protein [Candidatus Dormibacteraeota bacterium]
MKPAQLLLEYQRLVERERALRDDIARIESRLESDPEVVRLEEALELARSSQQAVAAQLRAFDHEREDHRTRLRSREKELMSGRIRSPSELIQLSDEVQHMKTRFAEEEAAQLLLMEDAEAADEAVRDATTSLAEARTLSTAEEMPLKEELEASRSELADVEAERDRIWARIPPEAQSAYSRTRVQPAVTRVISNQCAGCHVTVTTSGMQLLRRGSDDLVRCENCGRILVLA